MVRDIINLVNCWLHATTGSWWRERLPGPELFAPTTAKSDYRRLQRVVVTDEVNQTFFEEFAAHRASSRGDEEIGWVLLGRRLEDEVHVLAMLPAGTARSASSVHVRFDSEAQALGSRVVRQQDKRLSIVGVVHTHPGSLRHPSDGDFRGDSLWVRHLRGGEGAFGIGTADGPRGAIVSKEQGSQFRPPLPPYSEGEGWGEGGATASVQKLHELSGHSDAPPSPQPSPPSTGERGPDARKPLAGIATSQPRPHMQMSGELCFSWYALGAADRQYRRLPVELTPGPDLARPLHPIWPILEVHARRLDRLFRQLSGVTLETVTGASGGRPALALNVKLAEPGESLRLVFDREEVRYFLNRQGELCAVEPEAGNPERALYLILAELAGNAGPAETEEKELAHGLSTSQ